MSVKLRLLRRGRKQMAIFDIVAADARSPRDGKFIEKVGVYNPNTNPATIEINAEKSLQWLMNGAQPTDTVRRILSYKGVLIKKHLQLGVNKGAITQETADAKYDTWLQSKSGAVDSKKENLAKSKADDKKSRLAAESKVNLAREEAIKIKNAPVEVVAEAAAEVEAEAAAETEAPSTEVAE